jgi:uncharacterized membrane protein
LLRVRRRAICRWWLATTVVAVFPVTVSLALRAFNVISSPWLSMALAGALSFTAVFAGSVYWRERAGAGELLFSELLLWGMGATLATGP